MIKIFFLSFFFIGFCDCANVEYVERVGNPDDTAEIYRPCKIYDIHCIRRFFADHSDCRIANGPAPDPYNRALANYYVPRVNITINIINQVIRGLNGRIDEFYVNKNTDNLVISVEFRNLTQTSNYTYFSFHRKDREDIVTVDFAAVTYPSTVMTSIIPGLKDLSLEDAETTAYTNDSTSSVSVGPGIASGPDPETQTAFAEFQSDLPTNIQELFLTDAGFYMAAFIQFNICDFGLKVL